MKKTILLCFTIFFYQHLFPQDQIIAFNIEYDSIYGSITAIDETHLYFDADNKKDSMDLRFIHALIFNDEYDIVIYPNIVFDTIPCKIDVISNNSIFYFISGERKEVFKRDVFACRFYESPIPNKIAAYSTLNKVMGVIIKSVGLNEFESNYGAIFSGAIKTIGEDYLEITVQNEYNSSLIKVKKNEIEKFTFSSFKKYGIKVVTEDFLITDQNNVLKTRVQKIDENAIKLIFVKETGNVYAEEDKNKISAIMFGGFDWE